MIQMVHFYRVNHFLMKWYKWYKWYKWSISEKLSILTISDVRACGWEMVHASRAGCHFHIIPLCFMEINEFPLRGVETSDSICMDLQIPVKVKGWYGNGSPAGGAPSSRPAARAGCHFHITP